MCLPLQLQLEVVKLQLPELLLLISILKNNEEQTLRNLEQKISVKMRNPTD